MAEDNTTTVTREEGRDFLKLLVDTVRTNDQKPRAEQKPSNIIDMIVALLATWRGVSEGSIRDILSDDLRTQNQLIEDPAMADAAAEHLAAEQEAIATAEAEVEAEATVMDAEAAATSPEAQTMDASGVTGDEALTAPASGDDFSWEAAGDFYGFDASALGNIADGVEISDDDMANRDTAFGKSFLEAAAVLYEERKGEPVPENWSDERLANWADNRVSWFNNNIGSVSSAALGGTDRENAALMYLVEMNDRTEWTWADMGEGGLRMVADPSNILTGLAAAFSFGTGGAAVEASKQAARVAVKEAVTAAVKASTQQAVRQATRQAVKQSAIYGAKVGALEGAIGGAIDNAARQSVEMDVEDGTGNRLREDFKVDEFAFSTVVGTLAGTGAGAAINAGVARIGATEFASRFSTKMADWGFTWDNVFGRTDDANTSAKPNADAPNRSAATPAQPLDSAAIAADVQANPSAFMGAFGRVRNTLQNWADRFPYRITLLKYDPTQLNAILIPIGIERRTPRALRSKEVLETLDNKILDARNTMERQLTELPDVDSATTRVDEFLDAELNQIKDQANATVGDDGLIDEDVAALDTEFANIRGERRDLISKSIGDRIDNKIRSMRAELNTSLAGFSDPADVETRIDDFLGRELDELRAQLNADAGPDGLLPDHLGILDNRITRLRQMRETILEDALRQNRIDQGLVNQAARTGASLARGLQNMPVLGFVARALNIVNMDGFFRHVGDISRGLKKRIPGFRLPTPRKTTKINHFIDHMSKGSKTMLDKLGKADAGNFNAVRDQAVANYRELATQLDTALGRFDQRGGPKLTREIDVPMRLLAYDMGINISGMQKDALEQFARDMHAFADSVQALDSPERFKGFMEKSAARIFNKKEIWESQDYFIASTFEVGNVQMDGEKILPGRTNLAQRDRLRRAISQGYHPSSGRKLAPTGNRENYGYNSLENLVKQAQPESATYRESIVQTLWETYERGLELDALAHLEFAVNALGDNPPDGITQSDPIQRFNVILQDLEQYVKDKNIDIITKVDDATGQRVIDDDHFMSFIERLRREAKEVWEPNPQGTRTWFFERLLVGHDVDGRGHSRRENRKRIAYSALPKMIYEQYRESFEANGIAKATDAGRSYFKNNVLQRTGSFWKNYLLGYDINYDATYNGESGLYADPRGFRWDFIKGRPEGSELKWYKPSSWVSQGSFGRRVFNVAWRLSGLGVPNLIAISMPKHRLGGLGVYASAFNVRTAATVAGAVGMGNAIEAWASDDGWLQYHPSTYVNDPLATTVEVGYGTLANIPVLGLLFPDDEYPILSDLPIVGDFVGNYFPNAEAGFFYDGLGYVPYGGMLALGSEFTGIGKDSNISAGLSTLTGGTGNGSGSEEANVDPGRKRRALDAIKRQIEANPNAFGVVPGRLWGTRNEEYINRVADKAAELAAGDNSLTDILLTTDFSGYWQRAIPIVDREIRKETIAARLKEAFDKQNLDVTTLTFYTEILEKMVDDEDIITDEVINNDNDLTQSFAAYQSVIREDLKRKAAEEAEARRVASERLTAAKAGTAAWLTANGNDNFKGLESGQKQAFIDDVAGKIANLKDENDKFLTTDAFKNPDTKVKDANGNVVTLGAIWADQLKTLDDPETIKKLEQGREEAEAARLAAAKDGLTAWLESNGTDAYKALSNRGKRAFINDISEQTAALKDESGNPLTPDALKNSNTRVKRNDGSTATLAEIWASTLSNPDALKQYEQRRAGGLGTAPPYDLDLRETGRSALAAFNTLTDHDGDGAGFFVDTNVGRTISGSVQSVWRAASGAYNNSSQTRKGKEMWNGIFAFGGALFAPWALSKLPGFGWLNARGVRTVVIFAAFFLGWKALNSGAFSNKGAGTAGRGTTTPDRTTPEGGTPDAQPNRNGLLGPDWAKAEGTQQDAETLEASQTDDEGTGDAVGDGTGGHIPQEQRGTVVALQRQGGVNQATDIAYRDNFDDEAEQAIAEMNDAALKPEFAVSSTSDTPKFGSEKTVAALKAAMNTGDHIANEFMDDPEADDPTEVKVTLIHSTEGRVTESVHTIAGQTVILPVNEKEIGPSPYPQLATEGEGPEAELT